MFVYLAGCVAGGEFVVSEKYFLVSEILFSHTRRLLRQARFFMRHFYEVKNQT